MRLRTIVADSVSDGGLAEWVASLRPRNRLRLEIRAREPGAKEFRPIPLRWRVARTFAWLWRDRRLGKDYVATTASSEAFIKLAMDPSDGSAAGQETERAAAFLAGCWSSLLNHPHFDPTSTVAQRIICNK